MSEAELAQSIEGLRTEISGLERALLGLRFEDFKKVVLTQVQYVITEYYGQFLSSNIERIDCISTCPNRKDCRNELNTIFQGISSSFLKDDFETPLQELDRAEAIITGLHSPCQSKECSALQLAMVRDVKGLVLFVRKMFERVSGSPSKGVERADDPLDPGSASRMISPLAHPARIRILQELCLRDRGFTDLSRDLDLRTGHLQFHLRPLLDEGYVSKVRNRGEYSITARGRSAMDMVSMFSRRLTI